MIAREYFDIVTIKEVDRHRRVLEKQGFVEYLKKEGYDMIHNNNKITSLDDLGMVKLTMGFINLPGIKEEIMEYYSDKEEYEKCSKIQEYFEE